MEDGYGFVMLAFRLNLEQAEAFYELCSWYGADTEEKRTAILIEMARLGQVESVVKTEKTKEQYIKHLSKHFKVANLTQGAKENGESNSR